MYFNMENISSVILKKSKKIFFSISFLPKSERDPLFWDPGPHLSPGPRIHGSLGPGSGTPWGPGSMGPRPKGPQRHKRYKEGGAKVFAKGAKKFSFKWDSNP